MNSEFYRSWIKELYIIIAFKEKILYINILVKGHPISILINLKTLINIIFNWFIQRLGIEGYKKRKLYYTKIAEGVSIIWVNKQTNPLIIRI